MGFTGKTAVVIGGGAGIGASIAQALAGAGVRVMIADADADMAEAVAQGIGGLWAQVNPASNSDLGAVAYKAADALGDIDILVNAAPVQVLHKPLDQVTEAEFDALLLSQTKPLYLAARHFAPAMQARRSGMILNLIGPAKSQSVWADAARGWVMAATKSMALDLGPHGIRVNALSVLADTTPALPSFLGGAKNDDRARRLAAIPLGRYALPDDLAQAALFLCSEPASLITGMVLDIDGGAGL